MMQAPALGDLKRLRPEWTPWLAVVEEVLRETGRSAWNAMVPDVDVRRASRPVLAGATIGVQREVLRDLFDRLIRIASRTGAPKMGTIRPGNSGELDVIPVFAASLGQDASRLQEVLASGGSDAEALPAVAALLPVPFLQACNRRWTSALPEDRVEGYCPLCGSWPAFAEVRGIERSRYLRCGRCGAAWHAHLLHCPFCRTIDHQELLALVPQTGGSQSIDACRRCRGYVKTLTRLQGCAPGAVMLDDLASVELDIAALERGYVRPARPGWAFEVTVADTGGR